jgi:hypothetical protein
LIYIKQNTIEVNNEDEDRQKSKSNKLFKSRQFWTFNYKAFESVLKKSKFINNIIINIDFKQTFIYNHINAEEIFKIIIKNCNNLNSITIYFNRISDEITEKFGQKLREISFILDENTNHINKYTLLLRLCPNLIALNDKPLICHLLLTAMSY